MFHVCVHHRDLSEIINDTGALPLDAKHARKLASHPLTVTCAHTGCYRCHRGKLFNHCQTGAHLHHRLEKDNRSNTELRMLKHQCLKESTDSVMLTLTLL